MEFHASSTEVVLSGIESKKEGLSSQEAQQRLEKFGPNALKQKKKKNPVILFLNQFRSFIIYILLFALIISLIAGEIVDAITIVVILLFNAVFGFVQEFKAEKAIEALKKMGALQAQVLRNGKAVQVQAADLVPGDIVLLEEGNQVPADARLIESTLLQVVESSLTGESVPVNKHIEPLDPKTPLAQRNNMVYSGTSITKGRGLAVITATGMNTEIGKIANMISKVKDEQTPLQQKLETIGKYIGIGTIIICAIILVLKMGQQGVFDILANEGFMPFLLASKDAFLIAVTLAVAAVPEGLPAIVTITLAIGVQRMVKKHALIRKLPSVETLGETSVICSDKTGTITMNKMLVKSAFTNSTNIELTEEQQKVSKQNELLFEIGYFCNNASLNPEKGDPTEIALLKSAQTTLVTPKGQRLAEAPFDSVRKMMSVVVKRNSSTFVYTKGAPEHVLEKCTHILKNGKKIKLTKKDKDAIYKQNDSYAQNALRVLGFAYKTIRTIPKKDIEKTFESDLVFVGLQAMRDPPHPEVPEAIQRCAQAGIRVVMITGDNIHTATAIGHEIGIKGKAMLGADFGALDKNKQLEVLKDTSIFARVEPAHKMLIVDLLQQSEHIVAMTGDGVNDAPALKKANLGIAMGITGTDVAKETSDMVLQNDNFTSIVDAIEEGRGIFLNIRKFINYLLSCNLGEVLIVFFAIMFGWPAPITPIMLLWLNLVTDGLPALALGVDPNPKNLMKKPPKPAKAGIMSRKLAAHIGVVSLLITFAVLTLFWWSQKQSYTLGHMQTIAFTAIIIMELVRLHVIRSEQKLATFSNKWLVGAVGVSLLLQVLVIYWPLANTIFSTTPLLLVDWAVIIFMSILVYYVNKLISLLMDKYLFPKED